MPEFVTGGAVPLDSSAYVGRLFENECFEKLTSGRWVLLLGPRQHGKTSALVRLRGRLEEEGFRAALLDVQRYAGPSDDYTSFVRWFFLHAAAGLRVQFREPTEALVDDIEGWLTAILSQTSGSMVLLVDEASAVPGPLRVRFFSQLRAMYNSRALADPSGWSRRLELLYSGTFRPESMIAGDNSPFNVSDPVYSDDLTLDQARSLAETSLVGAELLPFVEEAFDLVGGQPYLLQRLMDAASAGATAADRERLFSDMVNSLQQGRDRHVPSLLDRVSAEAGAMSVVRDAAASGDGVPNIARPPQDFLPILGILRVEGSRLLIRNELYRQVVLASPQMSPASVTAAGTFSTLTRHPVARFGFMADGTLRELVHEAYASGVESANAGHYRFALVGFGAAYEGLLLDFLEGGLSASELSQAAAKAQIRGKGLSGSVRSWTFEGMIEAAHASGKLTFVKAGISNMIRDWRNLIHPDNAARNYQPQGALVPEVNVAVAGIEKLLQALEGQP